MGKDVKKVEPGEKKKGDTAMKDAISGTEAIRTWDEHMIGIDKLAGRLETNKETGLTNEQADAKHAQYGDNALSKK